LSVCFFVRSHFFFSHLLTPGPFFNFFSFAGFPPSRLKFFVLFSCLVFRFPVGHALLCLLLHVKVPKFLSPRGLPPCFFPSVLFSLFGSSTEDFPVKHREPPVSFFLSLAPVWLTHLFVAPLNTYGFFLGAFCTPHILPPLGNFCFLFPTCFLFHTLFFSYPFPTVAFPRRPYPRIIFPFSPLCFFDPCDPSRLPSSLTFGQVVFRIFT